MFAGLLMMGTLIEWLVWGVICTGLLLGLLVRIEEGMRRATSWIRCNVPRKHLPQPHVATFLLLAGSLAGLMLAVPAPAAAQGWWWGSPINPGFDRNTVIRVSGTATRVSLDARSGPATLTLECPRDTYTVILGPAWYLAQIRVDIREGDPLTVEGSKMMDRSGNLHLVAARVTNERTGVVLELRDDTGRPRWMGGPPGERGGRTVLEDLAQDAFSGIARKTTNLAVTERLRAVGAPRQDILLQFVLEDGAVTAAGGLIHGQPARKAAALQPVEALRG